MELITRIEFARRIGITRQAIDKAIKNDKLRLVGEGRSAKIDIHDQLSHKYMNDNSSSRQVAKQYKQTGEISENEDQKDGPNKDEFGESSKLRDEKLKLQTRKLQMEMAESMGDLVARKKVEEVFGKISSSIIAYIFPLSDRIGHTVAGVYESTDQDKINETKLIIDKEVSRALEAVKKEIADSLLEIEK